MVNVCHVEVIEYLVKVTVYVLKVSMKIFKVLCAKIIKQKF